MVREENEVRQKNVGFHKNVMTSVRRFQIGDMALMMRMSAEFLHEMPILDNAVFDFETTLATLDRAMDNPDWVGMIGFVDEKAAGMFIARRVFAFFAKENFACDVVFYIRPEFRGTLLIRRLVREYEKWANEDKDCIGAQLNAFASKDNERSAKLAEALGFQRVGFITYKKRK